MFRQVLLIAISFGLAATGACSRRSVGPARVGGSQPSSTTAASGGRDLSAFEFRGWTYDEFIAKYGEPESPSMTGVVSLQYKLRDGRLLMVYFDKVLYAAFIYESADKCTMIYYDKKDAP